MPKSVRAFVLMSLIFAAAAFVPGSTLGLQETQLFDLVDGALVLREGSAAVLLRARGGTPVQIPTPHGPRRDHLEPLLVMEQGLAARFPAIRAFRQSIERETEYLPAHTNLASIFGELGRMDEARESVHEILRLSPDFSIAAYMKGLSFSDPEILQRMEAGLRKAGLPE